MKVLLLRGNPRKEGFTQRLVDEFAKGVCETEAKLTDVDLTSANLQPCLGCFHCWLVQPGQCVHSDAMTGLLEQVLEADVIVCATPVYFFAMSSSMKVFFERLFPLSEEGMEPSGLGVLRNRLRDPKRWKNKKFISIVVGALRSPETYEPINQTFRLIADTLSMELGGQLTRAESHLLPYKFSKPKTLKLIHAAFLKAGREAGTTGRLTARTMEEAALTLAVDEALFCDYSNIFWGYARVAGARGTSVEALHDRVGRDTDILMSEMARTINPKTTMRLRAVLQFDFPDLRKHYRLAVDCGRCELKPVRTEKPDLRVTCDSDVWVALFTRQLNLTEALRSRRLVLEGDKHLFTKLDRYFPPPST